MSEFQAGTAVDEAPTYLEALRQTYLDIANLAVGSEAVIADDFGPDDAWPNGPHTRRDGRGWTLHPVHPPELLTTSTSDYLVLAPGYEDYIDPEASVEVNIEAGSGREFVVAYNLLDYRLHTALEISAEEGAMPEQFSGLRDLSVLLRKFGVAGEDAESCIREIIAGNLENVGDYGDRWFVIHRNVIDGELAIEVDYHSLEEVSVPTFGRYYAGLHAPLEERQRRLFGGKAGTEDAGESGRGILLTAALAEDGVENGADIDWIGKPEDAWTHLHFSVKGSEAPDNPLIADKSVDEILRMFDDGLGVSAARDSLKQTES
jgi:hypothetical protein